MGPLSPAEVQSALRMEPRLPSQAQSSKVMKALLGHHTNKTEQGYIIQGWRPQPWSLDIPQTIGLRWRRAWALKELGGSLLVDRCRRLTAVLERMRTHKNIVSGKWAHKTFTFFTLANVFVASLHGSTRTALHNNSPKNAPRTLYTNIEANIKQRISASWAGWGP